MPRENIGSSSNPFFLHSKKKPEKHLPWNFKLKAATALTKEIYISI